MATEFDFDQLDAITGGDAEFEREVLEEYLNSAPGDLAKVRDAVLGSQAATASGAAHALKGASGTIGAKGFAAIALEIEKAGKAGDVSTMGPVVERLEREFEALTVVLRARIAKAA